MDSRLLITLLLFISNTLLASTEHKVVQLTSSTFHQVTASYEVVFVNFYADWCRFSQILAPVFEEAYQKTLKEFDANRILFAKVDCETESDLSSRFHISKYPTLKVIVNGKPSKKEYRGQRSIDGLFKHVSGLMQDPIKSIISYSDYENIDQKKPAIIGYFKALPNAIPQYNTVRRVASDLKDDCHFYWVTGEATNHYLADDRSYRVMFKNPRSPPTHQDLEFPGDLSSYEELSTWSTGKCIPLVREITFENAEELTEEGLPFLILFHRPDDRTSVDAYTDIIHRELFTESSSINFLTADGVKFAHPLHHLGKSQQDLPLIAIDSFRHMYLFPDFSSLKVAGRLRDFVQDLHSGKLHREFHFGPDPSSHGQAELTSPPESTFRKLAPSNSRYTLLRDEL